ncbi:hypothetical protein CEXT_624471 [Caerostris extrusa]|uniref:Uncharacterized protein n=1 Tax=Caerostris extrusa TaxID=172846 RepID=A0AAV4NR99_CAEEX|nr:hypothetical protein CEXT_624471 [Caerostris extrusa]
MARKTKSHCGLRQTSDIPSQTKGENKQIKEEKRNPRSLNEIVHSVHTPNTLNKPFIHQMIASQAATLKSDTAGEWEEMWVANAALRLMTQ